MCLWSAPASVTHDDVKKNNKPAVATDDLIVTETPEKKPEEMNSVEEENKTNSDESEQAPPTSVTKVTVTPVPAVDDLRIFFFSQILFSVLI